MALMLIGVGFLIYRFVRSIMEKRAYETEELPDIFAVEVEDEILPDIEESGFAQLGADFSNDEESASEMYREIYDEEGADRKAK